MRKQAPDDRPPSAPRPSSLPSRGKSRLRDATRTAPLIRLLRQSCSTLSREAVAEGLTDMMTGYPERGVATTRASLISLLNQSLSRD